MTAFFRVDRLLNVASVLLISLESVTQVMGGAHRDFMSIALMAVQTTSASIALSKQTVLIDRGIDIGILLKGLL
jgi:hypothetical protein